MDDEMKAHLLDLFTLIGESFNRLEMVLMSDGSKESKLAILKEIAVSQGNIEKASAFLSK